VESIGEWLPLITTQMEATKNSKPAEVGRLAGLSRDAP